MTVTVAADVPLEILQAKLAEQNQWLPIDGDPTVAIGALVESNSTGPLRLGYGAWRDLLLGCQFTNDRNELITAGGCTMKNVAGYDLTKFMVGQRRVFGKIITLTTRTYRRPAAALLATFDPHPAILSQLLPTSRRPQWSLLTTDALLCGYLGEDRAIDYWQSALMQSSVSPKPSQIIRRTLEEDTAYRARLFSRAASINDVAFRASVPPTKIADFISLAQPATWSADPAFGIIVGLETDPANPRTIDAAKSCGGNATIEKSNASESPESIGPLHDILQRLKHAFGPHGIIGKP